jgi:purine-binding chemotaxis protein CheW
VIGSCEVTWNSGRQWHLSLGNERRDGLISPRTSREARPRKPFAISEVIQLVVFRLDEQRYALPLAAVKRIIPAVEVTSLPDAPGIVLGAIDLAGEVLPVLDIRQRFHLQEHAVCPADQFVIAQTARRTVALVVDEALGVIGRAKSAVTDPAQIVLGLEQLQGVIKLDDGLVLIHDLEKFLSFDEEQAQDKAMGADAQCRD